MSRRRVVTVVGARPQLVKASAVSLALERADYPFQEILVHTGQHYDYAMSGAIANDLELRAPDHQLGIGSGPHGAQTGAMLAAIESIIVSERPAAILVYGDTNSTLAGALAAAKLHVPVAHVEAGLRSFKLEMPEEINRVVTDHVASWLYAPSPAAVQNLDREGLRDRVVPTGDVMFDVLTWIRGSIGDSSELLRTRGVEPKRFAFATLHRAENADSPVRLGAVIDGLKRVEKAGLPVVFPVHPRTEAALRSAGLDTGGIGAEAPTTYRETVALVSNAAVVFTDSGGLQKEARWLGVPCVTLRDETEWLETLDDGWNRLVGADADRMAEALDSLPTGSPVLLPHERPGADDIVRHLEGVLL